MAGQHTTKRVAEDDCGSSTDPPFKRLREAERSPVLEQESVEAPGSHLADGEATDKISLRGTLNPEDETTVDEFHQSEVMEPLPSETTETSVERSPETTESSPPPVEAVTEDSSLGYASSTIVIEPDALNITAQTIPPMTLEGPVSMTGATPVTGRPANVHYHHWANIWVPNDPTLSRSPWTIVTIDTGSPFCAIFRSKLRSLGLECLFREGPDNVFCAGLAHNLRIRCQGTANLSFTFDRGQGQLGPDRIFHILVSVLEDLPTDAADDTSSVPSFNILLGTDAINYFGLLDINRNLLPGLHLVGPMSHAL